MKKFYFLMSSVLLFSGCSLLPSDKNSYNSQSNNNSHIHNNSHTHNESHTHKCYAYNKYGTCVVW